ncbi:MAG: hypothetical protein ACTSQE_07360 [Candidatus Heimdallarchaeaceae archaeon]
MSNILTPETIQEQPLPTTTVSGTIAQYEDKSTKSVFVPDGQKDITYPTQTIANNVIADSIDSQSRRILADYEFGQYGGIQVGKYVNGSSGDIRISPNGMLGRNSDGDTTFSIDGTTGDASFAGTISAGSVIAGKTEIGDDGNVYIDGANNRIIVSDGTDDRVLMGKLVGGF